MTTGPDDIPAIFLKNCAYSLTYPVTHLFNMSLNSGIFPDVWKETFIVPLHKTGDASNVRNYRPISKLCAVSQLFDSLVHKRLSNIFHPFIAPEQHGFVKGRSTLTNLLDLTENIHSSFSRRSQVDVIYTDYAKLFDKLNHAATIYKLKCSGVCGSLLRWFVSYLENRSQVVSLGSAYSGKFSATSGVPQGSHLGPLLFILFVNDLRSFLDPEVFLSLFADDCKIYKEISSLADCKILQDNLNKFVDYCNQFQLKLNLQKCQRITFSRSDSKVEYVYKLNGESVSEVHVIRDLGVVLDSRLSFREHINFVCNKALKMLGFVFRTCKPFNDANTVKTVYYSFVRSHLEYCSQVWNCTHQNSSTQIERIQRKFARFMFRKGFTSGLSEFHYSPVLESLNVRSLESRRKCSDVVLLLKIAFGMLGGLSLEPFERRTTNEHCLRSQRALSTTLNNSSGLNRCVSAFNSLGLDLVALQRGSFSGAVGAVTEAIPLFF